MIAILEAKRAGLLVRSQILGNLLAGSIVAVVAIPLAMAFAMDRMPFIDSAGLTALAEIVADFRARGTAVVFCGLRPNVLAKVERAGVLAAAGAGSVVASLEELAARADAAAPPLQPDPPPA